MRATVWVFCVCTMLIFRIDYCLANKQHRPRTKRHLIYPVGGGIFKLIVGFGIPTKLGIKQSMALGMNFQFQYMVPRDIAELEKPFPPIIAKSRERRTTSNASNSTSDRTLFYMGLEAAMNRNGRSGRSCMLRTICDNAMSTLKHESNGLFGELVHIALTPSYQVNAPQTNSIYIEAQRAGEFGVDCESLYPDCPAGANLLDMLSVLDN